MKTSKAAFAAGCFWGVEAAFKSVKGVVSVTSGYMGGEFKNPSYEDVGSGRTGHAETVLVEYDSGKVSYEELLAVFWQIHDPTQADRQGPDVGTQYRSIIFYYTDKQKKSALESLKKEQEKYPKKIATLILKAKEFYKAEEYHQDYHEKHPSAACSIKVEEFLSKGNKNIR